jgi:uncharacterized protein
MTDSPKAVFERLLAGITSGDRTELYRLYAEDTVVEQPYTTPEPHRLVGREALRAHFGRRTELPFTLAAENVVVHETADPEVVVAEYDYLVTATATGRVARTANVIILRVRNGEIVHSRDFHDHGRMMSFLNG